MLLWLGWQDVRRNKILNFIIVILLMIIFAMAISGISVIVSKVRTYSKIEPYIEHNGVFLWSEMLTRGSRGILYSDAEELKQYLPEADNVLAVSRWIASEYRGKDIEVWEYPEEVVDMLSPAMEQGRYFTVQDIYSNTLKGVVSHNTYGIQVGDVVRIDYGLAKGCYQEVEIVGVMEDDAILYQPQYYGEDTKDFRQCFQAYDYNAMGGKPVVLIAQQQILANQSQGRFSNVNFRLSDAGFMKEIQGPVIISYPDNVTDEQIDTDLSFLIDGATSAITRQMSLKQFNSNSRKYVFEELDNLYPVVICVMIFVLIAAVSAGVISVKKNMYNYAVYYMCGLRWMRCAMISLVSAFFVAAGALLLVVSAFLVLQYMGKLDNTVICYDVWQIIICGGLLGFFVVVSWLVPLFLVWRTSANKVLKKY